MTQAVKKLREDKGIRDAIVSLESAMKTVETLHLEPVHHFANGVYARELFMPAGSIVTSKIHKTEHFVVVLMGRVTVVQEDGRREVVAPYMSITKPGTKRALYVHEDTLWVTFHPTDKTSVEEIEQDIIAKDFDDETLLKLEAES